MPYPTPSDYQEAVQDPASAFLDRELQTATPRENVLGLPQPITGAFAAVFPMTTERGLKYAAKCFLSEVPNQQQRYAAVSEHLSTIDLRWTIPFDYQRRGITVDGTTYPMLKMRWAEGAGMNRFVGDHLDEPEVLRRLAERWLQMCEDLEAAGIAHGDLQHGNVRVCRTDDIDIRLVDYDTMYVPKLKGQTSAEVGHRNYQHPDRTDSDFGPALDRFSALAVYTALQACARHPELWQAYDTGENLLFRDGDFYAPDASPLFAELGGIDDLAPLTDALKTACYVEPEHVPRLDDVVEGDVSFSAATLRAPRDRRSEERSARRDPVERAFAPALALGLAVAGAVAGLWSPVAGALLAAVVGGTAFAVAGIRYRRHPVVRRDRRLAREADRITRLITNVRRQIESLRERRETVLDSVDEQRTERLQELREEVIYDHLKHHFIGELRQVEGLTHKDVVRLKSANIRTAYEATKERISELRRMPSATRTRIAMWRATLVQEAEDDLPDELSPAEERRLRRYVEHRIEDIDAEIRRAEEKIEVQSNERDAVAERREALPDLSMARYAGFLLRLVTLPRQTEHAPTPMTSSPARANAGTLPEPTASDGPWWAQQGGMGDRGGKERTKAQG